MRRKRIVLLGSIATATFLFSALEARSVNHRGVAVGIFLSFAALGVLFALLVRVANENVQISSKNTQRIFVSLILVIALTFPIWAEQLDGLSAIAFLAGFGAFLITLIGSAHLQGTRLRGMHQADRTK